MLRPFAQLLSGAIVSLPQQMASLVVLPPWSAAHNRGAQQVERASSESGDKLAAGGNAA